MSTLQEIIRHEIAKCGVLPFARFMELALYCPDCGYYETKMDIGRRGDFYTSVSAGPLFGELLARRFAGWVETDVSSRQSKVRIVEAGAHDGRLAADILNWLQKHRPELFSRIEYVIMEPSPRRQEWQKAVLEGFGSRVDWCDNFGNLKLKTQNSKLNGMVFSNELLDAFPVHRFSWDANGRQWFEWGVAADSDQFFWAKIRQSESDLSSSILKLPSSLLAFLPDGYIVETSPAAESWWREAAGVLARGKLLAIDYGFTADEMFSPARTGGTLRAYFRHHATGDLLANPGEQDLTAHVNFSAIQQAGEGAGLKTEFFGGQAKFLAEILESAIQDNSLGGWTPKQSRQFQTLTHPEHLGRAFRVLVQSR